jgi:hypothetical protein
MTMSAGGTTTPISEAAVRATISGDVSGQLAVGNHIVQIGSLHGDLVTAEDAPPRVVPLPRPVRQLPAAFPDLLGRETEIASAVAALAAGRRIGFHGVKGIGKHSLVRHVAHLPAAATWPDGILYCPGRGRLLADVRQYIFDGFYEASDRFTPTAGRLAHYLGSLEALIVVRDLELADDDVDELTDILPACNFLLTSANRRVWDSGRAIALSGLDERAAVALIERHLERPLTTAERDDARALASALHGHPRRLIQAATAASEGRSLADVLGEVSAEGEEAPARQLLTTLDDRERDLLAILASVDPAPLHLDRLVELTGSSETEAALASLRRKHLIQAHSPRYSLTIDVPARALEGRERWTDAVLHHYLRALDAQRSDPDHFREDVDALVALTNRAVHEERWTDVVALAHRADPVLAMARRWGARDRLVRQALDAAMRTGDRGAQAWCHHQLGTRALWLEERDRAVLELTRAVELRRALGDAAGAELSQFHLDQLRGGPPPHAPEAPPHDPPPRPPARRRRVLTPALLGVALVVLLGTAVLARELTDQGPVRDTAIAVSHPATSNPPSPRTQPTRSPGNSSDVPIHGDSPQPTATLNTGPGTLRADPSTVSFKDVLVGRVSAPVDVSVRNTGSAPVRVTGIAVSGSARDDFKVSDTCQASPLRPSGSCTVTVSFSPSAVGERTASVAVSGDGGASLAVPLAGNGTGPDWAISPGSIDFGEVGIGGTAGPKVVTVTNSGTAPGTIGTVSLAGSDSFTMKDGCHAVTVKPGASCDVSVFFTPAASDALAARLDVVPTGGPDLGTTLTGSGSSPIGIVGPGVLPNLDQADLAVSFCCGSTLTVSNNGPEVATDTTVTVTAIPAKGGFAIVAPSSPNPGCVTGSSQVTCSFGTVPVGWKTSIGLNMSDSGGGSFVASVTSSTADPDMSNNHASAP